MGTLLDMALSSHIRASLLIQKNKISNNINELEKTNYSEENEHLKLCEREISELSETATPAELAADQVLIDWFFTANLPTQAFDLDSARRVFDPEKFFAAIRREIDTRQSSPRWKCGATQFDLELLKNLFGGQETSS